MKQYSPYLIIFLLATILMFFISCRKEECYDVEETRLVCNPFGLCQEVTSYYVECY